MVDEAAERQTLEAGFWVGEYLAEPQLQRITKGKEEIPVEPKVMEVLVCLAGSPGKPISKVRFMEQVWNDTIVTDDALLRCISELRKIFGDDPRNPSYIETIRKRGYRLIAPVIYRIDADAIHARVVTASTHVEEVIDTEAIPVERRSFWKEPLRLLRRQTHSAWFWVAVGAFVLLVGAFFASQQVSRSEPVAPLKTTPLTSYPGEEADPNLSPEGDRIAFVWDGGDGGSFDIYIKQIGVATPLQLTDSPADDFSPAWSPDGRRIAFLRTGNGESDIFVMPAVGGSERKVASLGAREVRSMAWSSDGQALAFSAHKAPHETFSIWLLSLESLEMRPLTEPPPDYRGDLELAFSPNGRLLAFSRSIVEKVDDVYVVPVVGGEMKRITFDHAEITGLDWSADGKHIVFTSDREGASGLWQAALSGGAPTWIPTSGEGSGIHQPSVARRGGRMTFVQSVREINVWQVRSMRGGSKEHVEPSRPVIASTRWDSNPDLSPDGTKIAFASNRSGSYEIWMSERDGTRPVQLTSFGGAFTETPRWSPDGSHLVFVAKEEASTDIYVLDIDGGKPLRLTTADSNDKAPIWSRDGAWIYFASNRSGTWQTWKIRTEGGEPVQVTLHGGFAAAESLDGHDLFFVKRDAPGLWHMPAGGGPERRVLEALQPYDWGNWIVGEGGIYFVRRDAKGPVLAFYDFATDGIEVVEPLERVPKHPSLTVSSDGQHILCARIDRRDSDILFVEDFK